jgi:hypothetical protein
MDDLQAIFYIPSRYFLLGTDTIKITNNSKNKNRVDWVLFISEDFSKNKDC